MPSVTVTHHHFDARLDVRLRTAPITVELLRFQPQSSRTAQMFSALTAAASFEGFDVTVTDTYRGGSDLLLLWGPGSPLRFPAMRAQLDAGGHILAWDLAYWQRHAKLRVSIDGAHPAAWVLKKTFPRSRFEQDRVTVADCWNPDGPILVAGLGRKARVQYGEDTVLAWETEMIRQCEATYHRPIWYRPKQADVPVPRNAFAAPSGDIEDVLAGCSLAITWHSNVAVDAICLGIPVVCRDGAAAAVCPSILPDIPRPLHPDLRDRFLTNLAWFQWEPEEAFQCWAWVREILA